MSEESSQERTEQATAKHLKEARRKGRIQKSRDLIAWTSVAGGVIMVPPTLSRAGADLSGQLVTVQDVIADPSPRAAWDALVRGLASTGDIILPLLTVVAVTAVAAAILQGGVHLRRMEMNPDQFNLVTGLGRMVGPRALWEAAKTLVKAAAVGVGFWIVIQSWMPLVVQTGSIPLVSLLQTGLRSATSLFLVAVGAGLAFAGVDLLVVIGRNRKSTRMTKREVKDELKSTDGDPLVRSHRRSRQMALSRNRMIAAIADADVVIVNPTHVAVALRYDPGSPAPRVVAKGSGFIAARIREEARAQGIPMVEDILLARALESACQLGQFIPVELFVPVANVLAFVILLKRRGASLSDILTLPPERATRAGDVIPTGKQAEVFT